MLRLAGRCTVLNEIRTIMNYDCSFTAEKLKRWTGLKVDRRGDLVDANTHVFCSVQHNVVAIQYFDGAATAKRLNLSRTNEISKPAMMSHAKTRSIRLPWTTRFIPDHVCSRRLTTRLGMAGHGSLY